jgi:hypothetical protein
MTAASPFDRLPSATRKRLETLSRNVDHIGLEQLPLYAARPNGNRHQQAVDNAERVMVETARQAAVAEARRIAWDYIERRFAEGGYRPGIGITGWSTSITSGEDRGRLAKSFEEALTAIVLEDALDEADADELLGAWASLTKH